MPKISARMVSKSRKRKTRGHRARKNKLANLVRVVVLLVFSTIFLSGYLLYKFLNINFASAAETTLYNPEDKAISTVAYIVVNDFGSNSLELEEIKYVLFDKISKKVIKYSLPVGLVLDMPGDFSDASLSKVFLVAALNSDDALSDGVSLIEDILFKIFAFSVDNYIVVDLDTSEDMDHFLTTGGATSFLSFKNIIDAKELFKTDLTFMDFYDYSRFLKSLPSERIVERGVSEVDISDYSTLDDELRDTSIESAVSQERLSVAVLNGTEYAGFASFGARVVENIGGRVVAVNNSDTTYKDSFVIGENIDAYTAGYLADIFNVENLITKDQALNFSDNELDRADIVLILGLDTAKRLY